MISLGENAEVHRMPWKPLHTAMKVISVTSSLLYSIAATSTVILIILLT
jgi:hypothetical protein